MEGVGRQEAQPGSLVEEVKTRQTLATKLSSPDSQSLRNKGDKLKQSEMLVFLLKML